MISTLRHPKVGPFEPLLHACLAALGTFDVMPADLPVAAALTKANSVAMQNLEEAALPALLLLPAVLLQPPNCVHQA